MSQKKTDSLPKWQYLPLEQTRRFSPLVLDYLEQKEFIDSFFSHAPKLDSISDALGQRADFPASNRAALCEVLKDQYAEIGAKHSGLESIERLKDPMTFTVTTGQQLVLGSGPLLVIYKALQAVRLAAHIQAQFPGHHILPIFWLASEDHDFDEVDHFYFSDRRFSVQRSEAGSVGRTALPDLNAILQELEERMGQGKTQSRILAMLRSAYGQAGISWSLATRKFLNALFGDTGPILLDADDARLKRCALPLFEKELKEGHSHSAAKRSSDRLSERYKLQLHPRELNLFYLTDTDRKRLERHPTGFALEDGSQQWTESALLNELNTQPDRFSPNALLRPLYQECILPNVAYIGGAAEVSYWAQLKGIFEASRLPMPVVFLRQSIQIIGRAHARKMERLGWTASDLFRDQDELLREKIWDGSDLQTRIQEANRSVGLWAKDLEEGASAQGLEMKAAIEASLTRQQKELKRLEKKLLRSEKKRRAETVRAIEELLNELFPGGKLQERQMNWIEAELLFGGGLVDELMKGIGPEGDRFACLFLKD
ncbi:MAG: bacillithiol biosynthesis cysteine-adding enzyme BshC [Flavobacteriia bacterium]|nr:bacillithiol biosynthesis cysteine-adding enzyme BshC [Flavobacteriia bacterium]